jgi:hypothetical protein
MTNGEPPPPVVTDLQPASAGPLCPGETVEFEASTSPPSAIVTWTVAVNGGEPHLAQGDGNTLRLGGGQGETIVVEASLTNSRSATARWKVAKLEMNVPPGPINGRYAITAEPRMPVITATASAFASEWDVSVGFVANDCPPFGPQDLRTIFRVSRTGGNNITTDFFGDVVRGGSISFVAKGTVNGCPVSAQGGAGLVGTNPKQTDIQAALPHTTLRRIACKESGQRQFDAPPNGGTGFCPLFGPGGKVGIMQIANPTDDEIWNWRLNVAKGINMFNEKVQTARDYPRRVRNSEVFKGLVSQFNKRRQQQGLNPIQVVLPPLTEGDFDNNLRQLELDAIRGYNGWNGTDRVGLQLHEFRVAVDLIGGKEFLVVANVNEETLHGEAVWERVPVVDRPVHIGSPNYVEEVLSFAFDCTASHVPLSLDIGAERGTTPPCRILRKGASRIYRAIVAPAGGKFKWTCTGKASIVGSASKRLVTVKGKEISAHLDDVVLTLQYKHGSSTQTKDIKLTVAEVDQITVRVKASGCKAHSPPDQLFDCKETRQTAKGFEAATSLILLRGDLDDVELQATVRPSGTPLDWDVKRFRDDHPSLGTGTPTLVRDPADRTKVKVKTNETGSFFVRAFGDCGDKKFDEKKGPFKLVPMVLVQAGLKRDDSQTHPGNPQSAASVTGPATAENFSVHTGELLPGSWNPDDNAIHMSAGVHLVSGGKKGDRLIDRVFVGWVNNLRVIKNTASYTGGHKYFMVIDETPPYLDATRTDVGSGGDSVTPVISQRSSKKLSVGEERTEESLDSPFFNAPVRHPHFANSRLRTLRLDVQFSAHLCLWTDRGGDHVANRCYGVLFSYDWRVLGEWTLDNANNPTVVTAIEAAISGKVLHNPLVKPKDAGCEICPPTAQMLTRTETT